MTQSQFTYPAPGKTDISAAAKKVAPRCEMLRCGILRLLDGCGPQTADELAESMLESVLSIRPRVCELAKAGLIQDSGIRRKNEAGNSMIVWRMV